MRTTDHLRIVGFASLAFAAFTWSRPAEGTVQEQRARLPPPAECSDPVEGVWKSHHYSIPHGQWTEFTLHVRRDLASAPSASGTQALTGFIFNHSWQGTSADSQPTPCDAAGGSMGLLRYEVSMDARGEISGQEIQLWGVGQWRLDRLLCGSSDFGYNLDHFTGTIDPELEEFQSVNNDGGVAVNEPTLFRRIKCFGDGPAEEPVDVDPPPFQPPRAGCGLW